MESLPLGPFGKNAAYSNFQRFFFFVEIVDESGVADQGCISFFFLIRESIVALLSL